MAELLNGIEYVSTWVNPKHTVKAASFLMAGFDLTSLGVVQGEDIVGIVSRERLTTASLSALVESVMDRNPRVFDASETIRAVAKAFNQERLDYAALVLNGAFLGTFGARDLLPALSKSFDPMTGLCWSDELRSWIGEKFQQGLEVSILFVDIDNFGQYNKNHGHMVGDEVLKLVVGHIEGFLTPGLDLLVRYGGDEFVVGTLRLRPEAEALANEIAPGGKGIGFDGFEPVNLSVGVFGGRRTKERTSVHIASTVDNLINCASKAAIQKKKDRQNVMSETTTQVRGVLYESDAPCQVLSVNIDQQNSQQVTTVILSQGDLIVSGADVIKAQRPEESVVMATVKALERSYPGIQLTMNSLAVFSIDEETIVDLKGIGRTANAEFKVNTQRRSMRGPLIATAEATIEAISEMA